MTGDRQALSTAQHSRAGELATADTCSVCQPRHVDHRKCCQFVSTEAAAWFTTRWAKRTASRGLGSSPARPLACNWYHCAHFIAKPKAACALRFSWAATSSNLGL